MLQRTDQGPGRRWHRTGTTVHTPKMESEERGVKLKLIRKIDELAKQRPPVFLKQSDGSCSDKDGWSFHAVVDCLIGSYGVYMNSPLTWRIIT